MDLHSIITKYYEFINTSPNLSEHSKKYLLYETIINLFNEFIRFHDDYPINIDYEYYNCNVVIPIRECDDIDCTNEIIKNFLIENSIKNGGDFWYLRYDIEKYSSIIPTVRVSKNREIRNKNLSKDKKKSGCFVM